MSKRVVGHCTPTCGACCRILSLPHVVGRPEVQGGRVRVLIGGDLTLDGAAFLRTRGLTLLSLPHGGTLVLVPLADYPLPWWERQEHGVRQTYFASTCPSLQPDGTCALYGQPTRPQTCRDWPYPQTDLAVVPACTYRIVDDADPDGASVTTIPTEHKEVVIV